ncbi:MAG: DNA polymerase III subunit alpha, partial [Bacteroidota bacterium]
MKPVAGAEIRNGNELLYVLAARNNDGFREINEFITEHNASSEPYPDRAPRFLQCYVIYPLQRFPAGRVCDNEFAGIAIREINKLRSSSKSDYLIENGVILQPVSFADDNGYDLHRHLRAIENNILLSQLEPDMLAHPSEKFIRASEIESCYASIPQVIRNTKNLLSDCS